MEGCDHQGVLPCEASEVEDSQPEPRAMPTRGARWRRGAQVLAALCLGAAVLACLRLPTTISGRSPSKETRHNREDALRHQRITSEVIGLVEDAVSFSRIRRKDVMLHGEPVYCNEDTFDSIGKDGEGEVTWVLRFPQASTNLEQLLPRLGDRMPKEKIVWMHNSDAGGANMALVKGTMTWLESLLEQAPPGTFLYAEEDMACRVVPKVEAQKEIEASSDVSDDGNQNNPPSWGLDRIDARSGLDRRYFPNLNSEPSVHVYVLDTGVRTTHSDFGGRAIPGAETIGGQVRVCDPKDTNCAADRNGHGTHCAAIVAGHVYGVAKDVSIHAVKVLDDDGIGTLGNFLIGLDWVLANKAGPSIVSASLSAPGNAVFVSDAVNQAVSGGLTVVVAAGNQGQDACEFTPGNIDSAITVGATDKSDRRGSFSNLGACIDIWAPGAGIVSASSSGDTSTASLTGTSQACPHVAGAAALLLVYNPGLTPKQVRDTIASKATSGAIQNLEGTGSPDKFLYVNADAADMEPAEDVQADSGSPCDLGWRDVSGPCVVDDQCCLSSPNFPVGYGRQQICKVGVGGNPGPINVFSFVTEESFDVLKVNGRSYSGQRGPSGVIPTGVIEWSSDSSIQKTGWKICLPQRAQGGTVVRRAESGGQDGEQGCAARCEMDGREDTCANLVVQARDRSDSRCTQAWADVLKKCTSCFGCALADTGCVTPAGKEVTPASVWQPGGSVGADGAASTGAGGGAGSGGAGGSVGSDAVAGTGSGGAAGPTVAPAPAGTPAPAAAATPSPTPWHLASETPDHIGDAVDAVHDAIRPHVDNVVDAAGDLHDAVRPHVDNAANAVLDAAGDLHDKVRPHVDNVLGATSLDDLHDSIKPHLDNAADAALDAAGDLHDTLRPHVDNALDAARPHVDNALDAAQEHGGNLLNHAKHHLNRAANHIGGLAADAARDQANKAADAAVDKMKDQASAALQPVADTQVLGSSVGEHASNLHEAAKPHLEVLGDHASNALDALQTMTPEEHLDNAQEHLGNAADAVQDHVQEHFDNAQEHLDNAADALQDHAQDHLDKAGEHLSNAGEHIGNVVGGIFR